MHSEDNSYLVQQNKDIILSNQLYFPRLDRMGELTDGLFPEITQQEIRDHFTDQNRIDELHGFVNIVDPRHRLNNFVSCWKISTQESYLLWKAYTMDASAIAIKSSVGRNKRSLQGDDIFEIYLGKVRYHNEEDFIFKGNMYSMIMQKHSFYQADNELRIIANRLNVNGRRSDFEFIRVKVDLDILIEEVYLSSKASNFHKSQVELLLRENEIVKNVLISSIIDSWLHS